MLVDVKITDVEVIPPKYAGYRVLHKVEAGWQATPIWMPEVMPPMNAVAVEMTEAIQLMSYNLMLALNPLITSQLWTRVHDYDRAFTNENGFDKPGDPRANFILKQDLTSPLPKYDKCQRLGGGTFIRGIETASNGVNVLRCVAGIHGIDADKPMPSVQTIIANSWFVYAVSMDSLTNISHFPQGQGGPVAIQFLIRGAIEFPLQHFEVWQFDTLPDPLKIYRRIT